ncbi:MAG: hypothetical protein ACRED0_04940 [Gammaproteobacteria bacterium]
MCFLPGQDFNRFLWRGITIHRATRVNRASKMPSVASQFQNECPATFLQFCKNNALIAFPELAEHPLERGVVSPHEGSIIAVTACAILDVTNR